MVEIVAGRMNSASRLTWELSVAADVFFGHTPQAGNDTIMEVSAFLYPVGHFKGRPIKCRSEIFKWWRGPEQRRCTLQKL